MLQRKKIKKKSVFREFPLVWAKKTNIGFNALCQERSFSMAVGTNSSKQQNAKFRQQKAMRAATFFVSNQIHSGSSTNIKIKCIFLPPQKWLRCNLWLCVTFLRFFSSIDPVRLSWKSVKNAGTTPIVAQVCILWICAHATSARTRSPGAFSPRSNRMHACVCVCCLWCMRFHALSAPQRERSRLPHRINHSLCAD